MTANIMVSPPYQPFTLQNKFAVVFNGEVWCGLVDKDPLIPANQVQVYVVGEDGSRTKVPQPIDINSGGFLVYNGKPAKFVTDTNHSILVRDSLKNKIWYEPDMSNLDPSSAISILLNPGGSEMIGDGKTTVAKKIRDIYNSTHIMDVPGINLSGEFNNRDAIFSVSGAVFVPSGLTVKCNLRPTDDVRKFVGNGLISSTDQWGGVHELDIGRMYNHQARSDRGVILQSIKTGSASMIGVIGDSITDGADAAGWSPNPTDSNGNLSSSNYNHSFSGGAGSWFRTFIDNLSYLSNINYDGTSSGSQLNQCNASSSGKKLSDGWAYRNFDYGFFQNEAYGKKAPDALYIAVGFNDDGFLSSDAAFAEYRDELDKLICKAKGYGSSVALVTINVNTSNLNGMSRRAAEISIKESAALSHGINYYNLSDYLDRYRRSWFENASSLWMDPDGTYDTTHPKTMGHQFIGSAMTRSVAGEFIVLASEMVNYIPTVQTDILNNTYPSKSRKQVTIDKLAGGYLTELNSWGVINGANENITMYYPVWCESNELSMVIFEPYKNTYTSAGRANAVRIRLNDRRNQPQQLPIASSALSDSNKFLTTRVSTLGYGINWVEVSYDGAPAKAFIPGLLFRRNNQGFSVGQCSRSIAPNAEIPISLFGKRRGILSSQFQLSSPVDYMPDEVDSESYDFVGSFKIGCDNGGAARICVKDGSGIQVEKSSSSQIKVTNIETGAVIGTTSGNYASGFEIRISKEPQAQIRVSVIDGSGAKSDVIASGFCGGYFAVANTTSSPMVISVSGGVGFIN